jgi:hypothetical protein
VIANVESVLGDSGYWAIVKLLVGLVLVGEGALLATDWRRARRDAVGHVLVRMGRRRFWRFLLGPLLLGFGLVALGFGGLELVRAAQDAF